MSANFYFQCVLERELPLGKATLVTWIEERFAAKGKKVFIKDDPLLPDTDIWTVAKVGMKQTAEWVSNRQKAHERWRRVTDV